MKKFLYFTNIISIYLFAQEPTKMHLNSGNIVNSHIAQEQHMQKLENDVPNSVSGSNVSISASNQITIQTDDINYYDGAGGPIYITTGNGTASQAGGNIELSAGNGGHLPGGGPGGKVLITGGNSGALESAGNIELTAGYAQVAGTGGSIVQTAGNSASGNGGNIELTAGISESSATDGDIIISDQTTTYALIGLLRNYMKGLLQGYQPIVDSTNAQGTYSSTTLESFDNGVSVTNNFGKAGFTLTLTYNINTGEITVTPVSNKIIDISGPLTIGNSITFTVDLSEGGLTSPSDDIVTMNWATNGTITLTSVNYFDATP